MLLTVAAMILVLGLLIFVHELGHFLAAKSVGISVQRFSLGLGPRTRLAWRWGETEYCVSWVPFGGYVKMAGLEDEDTPLEGPRVESAVPADRTFDSKGILARVWVISAGVVMNALFCVALYVAVAAVYGTRTDPTTTVFEVREAELPTGAGPLATLRRGDRILRINGDTMTSWGAVAEAFLTQRETPLRIEVEGRSEPVLVDVPLREQGGRAAALRALVPWHEPVLGNVLPGWPAEAAGLRAGDRIALVDSTPVLTWQEFVRIVSRSPGDTLTVTAVRAADTVRVTLVPRQIRERDTTLGRVGVESAVRVERHGLSGAVRVGFGDAVRAAGLVLFTLKGLVLGDLSPRDLGGPILIGQLSGEAARQGLRPLLSLMALISMNLAILNLLPIPVLDGGHLVFLAAEAIMRRPVPLVLRQRLTQIGLFVLVAIMLFALFNDVTRPFLR